MLASSLPDLVGWVGWKLVVPWPLSTGHALEYLDRSPGVLRTVGAVALILSTGWALTRGTRTARLGLMWAVFFSAPVVWVLASTGWMGERYLYMAMLGIGWMAGAWTERWGRSAFECGVLWGSLASLVAVRLETGSPTRRSGRPHGPHRPPIHRGKPGHAQSSGTVPK